MTVLSRLTALSVAIGCIARALRLFDGRPLWEDEAFLALNVLMRSGHELLKPLESVQISPLGFVAIEWGVAQLGGRSEVALRTLPFLAGTLGLILLARATRVLLDPFGALVATAMAAFSPLLLDYSAEFKSYSFDFVAAVSMLLVTLRVLEGQHVAREIRIWAGIAVLSSLFSTAAPFIVAGACAVGVSTLLWRGDRRQAFALATMAIPAALVFLLQLSTIYSSASTRDGMQSYWNGSFLGPGLIGGLLGLARAFRELWLTLLFGAGAEMWLPRRSMSIVLALSAIGAWSLLQTRSRALGLVAAPLALAVLASLAQRWPMTPRLLLFCAPLVLLTIGAGVSRLVRWLPASLRGGGAAALACVLLGAAARGGWTGMKTPMHVVDVPAAMRHIGAAQDSPPTVYVSAHLLAACEYYSAWHPGRPRAQSAPASVDCQIEGTHVLNGRWPVHDQNATRLDGTVSDVPPTWIDQEVSRILESLSDRVWVMLPDDGIPIPARLAARGANALTEWHGVGIRVYSFELPPVRDGSRAVLPR